MRTINTLLKDAYSLIITGLDGEQVKFVKKVLGFVITITITVSVTAGILLSIGLNQIGEPVPGAGSSTHVVPAVGTQGYNVEVFCNDPATKVSKDMLVPPDSTFSATYNLDRTVNGVHEVVTVGFYADPNRQPSAIHYDSSNNPVDGFVSKTATECIQKKAGK